MIRPVVGYPLKVTAINDTYYKYQEGIIIWPNPATDIINIDPGERKLSGLSYIIVNDLYGREIIKVPFSEQIDISSLHEGIYFIQIRMNGRTLSYNRLIKTR
jgi:hypothetical protein